MKGRRNSQYKEPMVYHPQKVNETIWDMGIKDTNQLFRKKKTTTKGHNQVTYRGDCPTVLPPNRSSMIRERESTSVSGDRFNSGKVNDFPSLRIRD